MLIKCVGPSIQNLLITDTDLFARVRTLTGKEIELDIEPDYKVRLPPFSLALPRTIISPNSKAGHLTRYFITGISN
jgi:hypothetical protein